MDYGLVDGWISRRFTYCRVLFYETYLHLSGPIKRDRADCISRDRYSRGRNDTGSTIAPRLSRTRRVRGIERPSDDPALVIHFSLLPWRRSHLAMRFVGADCLRTHRVDPDTSGSFRKTVAQTLWDFRGGGMGRAVNLGALIFQEHLFAGIGNLHILCIAAILRLRFCAKEVVPSFLRTGFSSNRWCETASIQPWPLFAWHVFDVRFLPALEALK